jgi:hypothetical protein
MNTHCRIRTVAPKGNLRLLSDSKKINHTAIMHCHEAIDMLKSGEFCSVAIALGGRKGEIAHITNAEEWRYLHSLLSSIERMKKDIVDEVCKD